MRLVIEIPFAPCLAPAPPKTIDPSLLVVITAGCSWISVYFGRNDWTRASRWLKPHDAMLRGTCLTRKCADEISGWRIFASFFFSPSFLLPSWRLFSRFTALLLLAISLFALCVTQLGIGAKGVVWFLVNNFNFEHPQLNVGPPRADSASPLSPLLLPHFLHFFFYPGCLSAPAACWVGNGIQAEAISLAS